MSNAYSWVQWNAHKKRYDTLVALGVVGYLVLFITVGMLRAEAGADPAVLMMRALGTGAFVLLHVILAIGPLARLSTSFSPLLYNRRHIGVTLCALAVLHALIAVGYYGGFGSRNPIAAVLDPAGAGGVPFELLGFIALCVIVVMGVTSHDFWLKNLTPAAWKTLHMGVYVAYLLLVAHVVFGVLRSEPSWVYVVLLGAGLVTLCTLHLVAGVTGAREHRADDKAWVEVCGYDEIPIDRAATVTLHDGRRVAVFRHGDGVSAVDNVCSHQGGPLGEGKIVDGCVTCPWHGYQYRPGDGCSPPPYTEKIATYELRIEGGVVQLNTSANEPGTPVQPVQSTDDGEAS